MHQLNLCPYPPNFSFARGLGRGLKIGRRPVALSVENGVGDVYRITARSEAWKPHPQLPAVHFRPISGGRNSGASSLEVATDGRIVLRSSAGKAILQSMPRSTLGACGPAWLFWFERTPQARFYGMGEQSTRFEKSDSTHTFWNVDAHNAHPGGWIRNQEYDPDYIAVPYLILKQHGVWVGILVDSPYRAFISVSSSDGKGGFMRAHQLGKPSFFLGAEEGEPRLYVIYGPTLPELTRKLQSLVGRVSRPPVWALGYHQCRWGYRSKKDMLDLTVNFKKHRFPADGVWIDIDYMDGFRVFTFDKRHFPNPRSDIAEIQRQGQRVVPILDPGLKQDPGYAQYREGRRKGVYCMTPEGNEYVGMVWPGRTVFPDYSTKEGRDFWAAQVKKLADLGIQGCWIDMNDPATGLVSHDAMRFGRGKHGHSAFHNLYASLMAQATKQGFLAARPSQRPFILSRSGSTGSQQYAANWTGDNFSNYFHLRLSIPKCLNLSMSGMPFVGPDVGGFCDDTTDRLMVDWIKAGFLFPFLRNHTCGGTRQQEPWNLAPSTLRIMREYVRLRYKLLPYLYNLFVGHEKSGDPVMRPLFYEFDDARFDLVDDQFMIGPAIMQAPFVNEKESLRKILLPRCRWFRADTGAWVEGGGEITASRETATTPIFLREGAVIPMQKGVRTDNRNDFGNVDLLLVASGRTGRLDETTLVHDDGISYDYRRGAASEYRIAGEVRAKKLTLQIDRAREDHQPVRFTPVTVTPFETVTLVVNGTPRVLTPVRKTERHFGRPVDFYHWK